MNPRVKERAEELLEEIAQFDLLDENVDILRDLTLAAFLSLDSLLLSKLARGNKDESL